MLVVEFADGLHEYVTTVVRRVLRVPGEDVYYVETTNSRYRLEVRRKQREVEGATTRTGR